MGIDVHLVCVGQNDILFLFQSKRLDVFLFLVCTNPNPCLAYAPTTPLLLYINIPTTTNYILNSSFFIHLQIPLLQAPPVFHRVLLGVVYRSNYSSMLHCSIPELPGICAGMGYMREGGRELWSYRSFSSILVVSCFMWSGALNSYGFILSCHTL